MPHVTDGSFAPVVYEQAWSPILGNNSRGGICPAGPINGTDEALYAVRGRDGPVVRGDVTGTIKCYRTNGGHSRIVEMDNSVEEVGVIDPNYWSEPAGVGLTRINDTPYAIIAGRIEGTPEGGGQQGTGTWCYRDNSAAGDGSGPWTRIGTLHEDLTAFGPYYGGDEPGHFTGETTAGCGGEIVILPSGLWMSNLTYWSRFGGESVGKWGVATSADQGVTWTHRLGPIGWYMNGGIYGYSWSNGFGQIDGHWYVGGHGNVDAGKHFKSADGISWTHVGDLGFGNSAGAAFPISIPGLIFQNGAGFSGNAPPNSVGQLRHATGRPEDMPTYTHAVNLSGHGLGSGNYPKIANYGREHSPMWCATDFGRVLGFRRNGWQINMIGF